MLFDKERAEFIKKLEKLGEIKVREWLYSGSFNIRECPIVESWLEEKQQKKKDTNFYKQLDVAKEANKIAYSAKKVSCWAIAISIISILIAIFKK